MSILGMLGGAALQTGMDIGKDEANNQSQYKYQRRLNKEGMNNSKELSKYNKDLQMEMWEETNYAAQRREMEKAGLNVGMMYGGTGAGGATTNVSTANVSGGQAGRGGNGNAAAGMALGMQNEMMQAQIDNINADTELKKTDATKTSGTDTEESQTRIKDLLQGIENKKAQQSMTEIETRLKEIEQYEAKTSQANRMDFIEYQTQRALTDLENARNETFIGKETINEKIKIIQATAVGAMLDNALKEAGITKTKEETRKIGQDILQAWEQLKQSGKQVNINEFREVVKAEYPSIMEVGGKAFNDIFVGLERMLERATNTEKYRKKPE